MVHIMRINEMLAAKEFGDDNIAIVSFHGFYNTVWSEYDNDQLIDTKDFEDKIGHYPEHLDDWSVDWEGYKKALGEFYVNEIEKRYREVFGNMFSLQYDHIWSPREYNFQSDTMYAKLIVEDKDAFIASLTAKMNEYKGIVEKAIKEHHSSRSGFISSMSNNFGEWIAKVGEFDTQYIGYAMYYAYCADEFGENESKWDDLEYEIYEDASGNGCDMASYTHPSTDEARAEYDEYLEKQ